MPGIKTILVWWVAAFAITARAGEGPPAWVRQLERFDIAFEIEWDVQIFHRPNHRLAKILRKNHYSPWLIRQIEAGQCAKKKYSMLALNCQNFRANLIDINLSADNSTREYSSSQEDGSKVKTVNGGMPRYYPEPMRYFGALSTGLLQTQIIDFLPRANRATIIREDQWPKIYELISDGK